MKGINQIRYDDEAVERYEAVKKAYPKYPFSYYLLAEAYRLRRDTRWRDYAIDAVKILQITTSLPNHATNHDDALKNLTTMLFESEATK